MSTIKVKNKIKKKNKKRKKKGVGALYDWIMFCLTLKDYLEDKTRYKD